jgi:hypothetical protein
MISSFRFPEEEMLLTTGFFRILGVTTVLQLL